MCFQRLEQIQDLRFSLFAIKGLLLLLRELAFWSKLISCEENI